MLPQLDIYWYSAQVFWLCVTFLFLFLAVNYIIAPRLAQIVEGRKRLINTDLQQAKALNEEARMVLEAYNTALQGARQDISDIIASTTKAENQKIAVWNEQCSHRVEQAISEAAKDMAEKEALLRKKLSADVAVITAMALKEWTADNIPAPLIKDTAVGIYNERMRNA